MVGVAIHLSWHIIWWYFVLSILIYSISIISLTFLEENATIEVSHLVSRFLLGCHLAFLFLAGGLWLNFPNFFVQVGIFLSSVAAGLVIPFLLLRSTKRTSHNGTLAPILAFNGYGLLGLVAIALVVSVAFYLMWNIIWWYFVLSILIYSIAALWLTIYAEDSYGGYLHFEGVGPISEEFGVFRWLLGFHLALLLLAGGLWLNFSNFLTQAGIFLAAIAAGVAIPFLLLRGR
jgi:hypothetical protein